MRRRLLRPRRLVKQEVVERIKRDVIVANPAVSSVVAFEECLVVRWERVSEQSCRFADGLGRRRIT